ncbi:hypothetical protein GCM10023260_05750 [Bartonella acomydis]|uniref:tRNA threonylcarbamoyladenosine biosynthesis protein TsaE n=1 Tax=Bartonella acomydis TaxID=686234 RepID=A0ABP9ML44_9HYPH
MNFSFFLENEEATKLFAQDLALALKPGDLVTLQGDLGAGKSTIARTIIHTLANDTTLDVPSPTFTLVQNYYLPKFEIIHADFYRLSMAEEIDELGLHEAREQSILLIEWPEKGVELLEPITFSLTLQQRDYGRHVTLTAAQHSLQRLQRSFAIRTFLRIHGRGHVHRHFLAGDVSGHTYELLYNGQYKEVLMDVLTMQMKQNTDPSYITMARLTKDLRQLVGINQLILENDFSAPHIFVKDFEKGLLILGMKEF